MDLREYLFRNRLSIAKFSKMINYNPNYISGVVTGKMKPGKKFIRAVKAVTKGAVEMEYQGTIKEPIEDDIEPRDIIPSEETMDTNI